MCKEPFNRRPQNDDHYHHIQATLTRFGTMTATTSPTILVAGKTVGRLGYGLMGLSAWGLRINPVPFSQEDAFAAMKAAVDSGANC